MGALNSIGEGVHRRDALWQVERAGRRPGPLLAWLDRSLPRWQPVPPRSAKELAIRLRVSVGCFVLRLTEQLALKSEALTSLAEDWRKLLFPEATEERFTDGYAQAVTFGLLMARAKKIELSTGLQKVASALAKTSSLIGAALRLLTNNATNQETLKTALGTLIRVLDVVDLGKIVR